MLPRRPLIILLSAGALGLGLTLPSFGDHAHRLVDGKRFMALMGHRPSSTSHVDFIGTDGSRAYLTYWKVGVLGGDTHDVYSVSIDDLPGPERQALREGRNPWWKRVATNDPGLRPAEQAALERVTHLPPKSPIVVVMRCWRGETAQVARDHFDNAFADDAVVPVPVPCSLVLLVTTDEPATLRAAGKEARLPIHPNETIAHRHQLSEPGDAEVVVEGRSTTWRVRLRGAPAVKFYEPGFDQRRSK